MDGVEAEYQGGDIGCECSLLASMLTWNMPERAITVAAPRSHLLQPFKRWQQRRIVVVLSPGEGAWWEGPEAAFTVGRAGEAHALAVSRGDTAWLSAP